MTWNVVSLLFVFYVVTLNNRTLNRCKVTKSNNRKSPCFFFFLTNTVGAMVRNYWLITQKGG